LWQPSICWFLTVITSKPNKSNTQVYALQNHQHCEFII
jgi:hypothetical protein